jgi:hypothetical protein
MQSKTLKLSVGLLVAAVAVSAFVVNAQAPNGSTSSLTSTKTQTKNVQVVDVTPKNQVWPRIHVIYDFDAQEVRTVAIDGNQLHVGETQSLISKAKE